MIELQKSCDIWDKHNEGCPICITTNYGWKSNGHNVMGAGIAKQARLRFPELPKVYGAYCRAYHQEKPNSVYIPSVYFEEFNLFCCATKSLNKDKPNYSWCDSSSIYQIKFSAQTLNEEVNTCFRFEYTGPIYLTHFGCGKGQLNWIDVKPELDIRLSDRFVVVEKY